MKGKTCVVTGANSGIGYETARGLAKAGARVFLLCRNPEKGKAAVSNIQREVPSAELRLIIADLSSQQQIRRASKEILQEADTIDVLVNNAGAWFSKRTLTEDGIESVFAINHLAYVLLTHLLYPAIRKAPDARIINVSSDNHFDTKIHFDNLYLDKGYNGLKSYAQSKLGNVLFTFEFDRRKPDPHITINAVQPGLGPYRHRSQAHLLVAQSSLETPEKWWRDARRRGKNVALPCYFQRSQRGQCQVLGQM